MDLSGFVFFLKVHILFKKIKFQSENFFVIYLIPSHLKSAHIMLKAKAF